MKSLMNGLAQWSLAMTLCMNSLLGDVPADDFFRVETLAEGFVDAMEMTVLPTGDVFIAERTGALKWYSPDSGEVKLVKQFKVSLKKGGLSRETGLLGVAADANFMKNGSVYLYYSLEEKNATVSLASPFVRAS